VVDEVACVERQRSAKATRSCSGSGRMSSERPALLALGQLALGSRRLPLPSTVRSYSGPKRALAGACACGLGHQRGDHRGHDQQDEDQDHDLGGCHGEAPRLGRDVRGHVLSRRWKNER
jgi:hypothetical protein